MGGVRIALERGRGGVRERGGKERGGRKREMRREGNH
jgi:hypothetical protein